MVNKLDSNMKRYLSFFIIILAFFFSACNSDDEVKERDETTWDLFKGEWFSEDNNTYWNLTYSAFSGFSYDEVEFISKEVVVLTGKWMYFLDNRIIRMETHYSTRDFTESRDFKVLSVDANSMVLYDLDLNAQYTFYRVKTTQQLMMGESFEAGNFGPSSSFFYTTCDHIAKVNASGHVVATGPGSAYIGVSSNNDMVYVRVDVGARVDSYALDIQGTIDDVIRKYGTPDYNGPSETPTMAIEYVKNNVVDASMEAMIFKYDADTREVTEIRMLYNNDESFNDDLLYLRENYYPFIDDTSFAVEAWFSRNTFYIHQFVTGNQKCLLYHNMNYSRKNGYV